MPWVKLDDAFFRHPRIVAAGRDARDLFLAGLCYASSQLTDGFVPAAAVRLLLAEAEIEAPAADVVARLMQAGLWTETETGYQIRDYLDYNPSAEQVKARRAATADRVANWRAARRVSHAEYTPVSNAVSNAVTNTVGNRPSNAAPDPVPDPVPDPEESPAPRARAREAPVAEQGWPLVDAMLTTLETAGRVAEGWVPSGRWRARQQAIGAELAADGWTAAEVADLVGWLLTHPHWGTTDLDMKVIRETGDNWRREGRPPRYVAAPGTRARASPARPGSLDVIIDGLTTSGQTQPAPFSDEHGGRHARRDVPRRTSDPADRVAAPRAGRGDRGGALPRLPRGPG